MGNTTMTLSSPWRFSHTSAGCRASRYNSRRTGNVPNGSKLLPGTNIRCMKHGPNRVSVPILSRISHEVSSCVPLRLCRKLPAGEPATLVCSKDASLDKWGSASKHLRYRRFFGAAAPSTDPPDDGRPADSVRRPSCPTRNGPQDGRGIRTSALPPWRKLSRIHRVFPHPVNRRVTDLVPPP
jgi:hypothetical protein